MNRASTWKRLQTAERVSYRAAYDRTKSYRGFFSIAEYGTAVAAGRKIAGHCTKCLDVGCGVLPLPAYMQTYFVGVDPFFGEGPRRFLFAQAIGEHLPFPSGSFPCVSFMSTLDHQVEPLDSLKEAWRVLLPGGRLFLWLELRVETDGRYCQWKVQPPGALFDDHHQHAFVEQDIRVLLESSGFRWAGMERYSGADGWPDTQLIVGEKGGHR